MQGVAAAAEGAPERGGRFGPEARRQRMLDNTTQARWSDPKPKARLPRSANKRIGTASGPATLIVPPAEGLPVDVPYDSLANALVLVDKPRGWTSFDVCNAIRRAITPTFGRRKPGRKDQAKVGHAGTLDPLATGLMLVCVGAATKTISGYSNMDKAYTGSMRLGQVTPSLDCATPVSAELPWEHISPETVNRVLSESFVGEIMQVPPMYSAKSIGGERLYDKARRGEVVERDACSVTVFSVAAWAVGAEDGDLAVYEQGGDAPPAEGFGEQVEGDAGEPVDNPDLTALPPSPPTARDVMFRVSCSKGFYVRSLVDDVGKELGCGAHMTSLRRTSVGPYKVEEAWPLDKLVDAIWDAKRAHFPKPPPRGGRGGGRGGGRRGNGRGGGGGPIDDIPLL